MQKPIILGSINELGEIPICMKIPNIAALNEAENTLTITQYNNNQAFTDVSHYYNLSDNNNINWIGSSAETDQNNSVSYGVIDMDSYYVCFPIEKHIIWKPHINELVSNNQNKIEIKAKILNEVIEYAEQKNVVNEPDNYSNKRKLNPKIENNEQQHHDQSLTDKKIGRKYMQQKISKDVEKRKAVISAVAIGNIEKTDADWDYSVSERSDDEEQSSDSVKSNDNLYKNYESSDNEQEELNSYGSNINRVMAQLTELEVEASFANASNDLDNDNDETKSTLSRINKNSTNISYNNDYVEIENSNNAYDRLETEDKIKEKLLQYVNDHPGCDFKVALSALNIDIRGNRVEVIRGVIRDHITVKAEKDNNNQNIKALYIKK